MNKQELEQLSLNEIKALAKMQNINVVGKSRTTLVGLLLTAKQGIPVPIEIGDKTSSCGSIACVHTTKKDEIIRLYNEGVRKRDIALKVDAHYSYVNTVCADYERRTGSKHRAKSKSESIREAFASGKNIKQICTEFDVEYGEAIKIKNCMKGRRFNEERYDNDNIFDSSSSNSNDYIYGGIFSR